MAYRIDHDTLGEVRVPIDRYWGAQTQRSLENFPVGWEKMPMEIIRAFSYIKEAAARSNHQLGTLDERRRDLICQVCQEIRQGLLDDHFPLSVWQTGSGTQSNMNCNEVIAHRGNALAGEELLHPNDHVNQSQSSNDTFPTAMHVAAMLSLEEDLFPALERIIQEFRRLEEENPDIIKIGRTHLQDATPLRFAQEVSGWRSMLEHSLAMLKDSLPGLREIALGGTAVGTGVNTPPGFCVVAARQLSQLTGIEFRSAENKFHALTAKDALVFAHGGLKALAADLMKIANDIRWLASGPRCGIGEITIPANEPGSSIMPGKVNPTQCEMMTMVAVQVMGNDTTVGIAASQGNFELNVFMPVLIYNFLQSVRLLTDGMNSFRLRCLKGLKVKEGAMKEKLERSLMLVTALNPHIGYENGAKVAKYAYEKEISLKEAAIALGLLTGEEFDRLVDPEKMV